MWKQGPKDNPASPHRKIELCLEDRGSVVGQCFATPCMPAAGAPSINCGTINSQPTAVSDGVNEGGTPRVDQNHPNSDEWTPFDARYKIQKQTDYLLLLLLQKEHFKNQTKSRFLLIVHFGQTSLLACARIQLQRKAKNDRSCPQDTRITRSTRPRWENCPRSPPPGTRKTIKILRFFTTCPILPGSRRRIRN